MTKVSICPLPRTGTLAIEVLMNGRGAGAVETGVRVQNTSFTKTTRQKDDEGAREEMVIWGGNEEISKTEMTDADVVASRHVPDVNNNLGASKW